MWEISCLGPSSSNGGSDVTVRSRHLTLAKAWTNLRPTAPGNAATPPPGTEKTQARALDRGGTTQGRQQSPAGFYFKAPTDLLRVPRDPAWRLQSRDSPLPTRMEDLRSVRGDFPLRCLSPTFFRF